MTILILTGRFGAGHCSAARALRQQLLAAYPAMRVQVVDFFSYAMPGSSSEAMYHAFRMLVTYGAGIFNTYYRMSDLLADDHPAPLERPMREAMSALLREFHPDAVVATHPLCARLTAHCRRQGGASVPLITCVTDFSQHAEWIYPETDAYLVGSPELRRQLAGRGVDPARIFVTGIPVRPEFKQLVRRPVSGSRQLLVMGGGLGLVPWGEGFYKKLAAQSDIHVTVLTGGNQRLLEHLSGRYPNITAVGYTERVFDYMAQADLLLSKPGGITVFESISAELPMLLWTPTLAQERENARFLIQAGLARMAGSSDGQCMESVCRLIRDTASLERMSRRMRRRKAQLEEESFVHLVSSLGRQVS